MGPRSQFSVYSSDSGSLTSDDFDSRMGRTPNTKTYEKALIATQRDLQTLREKYKALNAENKALKREITSLKEQLDAPAAAATRETNGIATEMELIKTLAKKYTALYEPFSRIYNDPNLFVSPRPPFECMSPKRRFCTDLIARRDGWLAQLYEFLPEKLHPMVMNYSNFDTEFRAAAKTMRSAIIDRMRKAASSIFKLHPDIFKPSHQRETVPQLTQLLKFSNEPSKHPSKKPRPSKLPPILFPPSVRQKGLKGYETKLFQVPEIFLFMKALLFGLSSLDTTDLKHGGPSTYGKQWGVVSLENLPFYAIPLFALLTVFVISEDSDFGSQGPRSGRNWEDYFDYLRLQFHTAHGTREFRNIMTMCNDIVFHGQAKGNEPDCDASDSGESEINWQMQALQLSDEDDTHESRTYDDLENFSDDEYDSESAGQPLASPSTKAFPSYLPSTVVSHPTQSPLLMPPTPQRAPKKPLKALKSPPRLVTLPALAIPKTIPPPSSTQPATLCTDLLFPPIPPTAQQTPSTPQPITLVSDESDKLPLPKPAPRKKAYISKAKQRTVRRLKDGNPKKTLRADLSSITVLAAASVLLTSDEETDLLSEPAPVAKAKKKVKSAPLPLSMSTTEVVTREKRMRSVTLPSLAITAMQPQHATGVQEVIHHSEGEATPLSTAMMTVEPQPAITPITKTAKAKPTSTVTDSELGPCSKQKKVTMKKQKRAGKSVRFANVDDLAVPALRRSLRSKMESLRKTGGE